MRCAGSAPANASTTYSVSRLPRNSVTLSRRCSNPSSGSSLLPSHQIRSSEPGSRTMNLSCGERPVCLPVSTTIAPPSPSRASPRAIACSWRTGVEGFQTTTPTGLMPCTERSTRPRTSIVVIGSSPSTLPDTRAGAQLLRGCALLSYALVPEAALTDGIVTLRPWRASEAPAIVDCLDGDPEVARWLDQIPQPYTIEHARAYLDGELGRDETKLAITDAATGRILGSIGVGLAHDGVREIGYWLRADARGRGVTTRALRLASRWALAQDDVARV